MTAIHETAYPRIKPHFTHQELQEIFSPTEEDLELLNKKTKKTLTLPRLGFMLTLKCYQYRGKPVNLKCIDVAIKKYVANKLDIDSDNVDLTTYDISTRKRHIKIIREYLGTNADKKKRRDAMKAAALEAAATKENLADIVNSTIDELTKSKFELPSFKRLLRLARAARTVISQDHYEKIVNHLTEEQKQETDTMIGLIKPESLEDKADKMKEPFSWATF